MSALASDAAGNITRSAAVPVRVDNVAPSAASVLSPAANVALAGTKGMLASASDNVAVTKLEFRATGGTLVDALVGTAAATPYGWLANWNTAGSPTVPTR